MVTKKKLLIIVFQPFNILFGEFDDFIKLLQIAAVGFDERFVRIDHRLSSGKKRSFAGNFDLLRRAAGSDSIFIISGNEVEKFRHTEVTKQFIELR